MSNGFILAPLPIVSVTADTTAGSTAAANVTNDFVGVVWRSAAGTSARLDVDLGSDQVVDTIVLFGLAGAPADAELTVHLATEAQGAFTGARWTGAVQPLYAGAVMPVIGKGRALWLAPAASPPPAAVRYVRLGFDGPTNYAAEVSRVVIGKRFQPARNFVFGGGPGVRDLGALDYSPRGVLMRRRAAKLRTLGLTWANLYRDEFENGALPLMEAIGNTEMVAMVSDPDPHPQRQNRIYYGSLFGEQRGTLRNAVAAEWPTTLVGGF